MGNDKPVNSVIIDYNWYNIIPIEEYFNFKAILNKGKNDQLEEIGEYFIFYPTPVRTVVFSSKDCIMYINNR